MKRILVLALAFTVLVFSVYPLDGHVQIVASATATAAMEACYDDETDLNYYLYTPEKSAEGMPLIVYLHGGSGKGGKLSLLTDVDGFPRYLQQGLIAPHAYVLLPQLPESQRGWEQVGEKLVTLIQKTVKAYSLDEKNISLTGHSMGGSGTWSLALSYPPTVCTNCSAFRCPSHAGCNGTSKYGGLGIRGGRGYHCATCQLSKCGCNTGAFGGGCSDYHLCRCRPLRCSGTDLFG